MAEELENQQEGKEESPEQKADKETKKYQKVMEVVKAVVGGEGNLRPPKKVDADETASIVAELFKEEGVELRTRVKEGLKNLLKQHVQLESDIKKKEQELKQLQLEKRKEFTKAANAWLQQIDQAAISQELYVTALKTALENQEKRD